MFDKIKSWCWHSLTVAWGAALALVPEALNALPVLVEVTSDPEIAAWVQAHLPPAWLMHYTAAIGALTVAARLRSLVFR